MLMVRDKHVDLILEAWPAKTRISDESYIPTLLQTYNATSEVRQGVHGVLLQASWGWTNNVPWRQASASCQQRN